MESYFEEGFHQFFPLRAEDGASLFLGFTYSSTMLSAVVHQCGWSDKRMLHLAHGPTAVHARTHNQKHTIKRSHELILFMNMEFEEYIL